MTTVTLGRNEFLVECPAFENERIKAAPKRKWDRKRGVWTLPATKVNAMFLKSEYSSTERDPAATARMLEFVNFKIDKQEFPPWYEFKTQPRSHQIEALNFGWSLNELALFMTMRAGKSWVAIQLAAARGMEGQINGLVIICPTMVKPVWELQIEEHSPLDMNVYTLMAGDRSIQQFVNSDFQGLKVLIIGVEGLSQGQTYNKALNFMSKHRCMVVVDESHTIKNDSSTRTNKCYDIAGFCKYKIIMTGTSITQGMEDLYSQYRFLDWEIIGHRSYYTFRNRYCIIGGFEGRQIVGYRNSDELIDLIAPHTFQITEEDLAKIVDFPDKVYETVMVEPNKEQERILKELGDPFLMETSLDDDNLEVATVLERMIRYQQITGGIFPFKDEDGNYNVKYIPGKNPKLEAMMEVIDGLPKDTKIIIWARFRPEIALIVERLAKKYGSHTIEEYHGGTLPEERKGVIQRFQMDYNTRFFVSNQQSGGQGLELSAASVHIYFSNSFAYKDRKQSEARTNSSSQKAKKVLYIDITMTHNIVVKIPTKTGHRKHVVSKIDVMITNALQNKQNIAEYVEAKIAANKS